MCFVFVVFPVVGVVPADVFRCCYRAMYLCCRLEAPRYRRVSPVSGEPQRLIITKEVGGLAQRF